MKREQSQWLTAERAREISAQFSKRRIAVAGDVMLDRFIWGEVSRISPEAPVPVVEIQRESAHLGGAGNVANNLRGLGAGVMVFSVAGDDEPGREVRSMFHSLGIATTGLIVTNSRPTTTKTRIVAHSQQVVRADREDRTSIGNETESRLLDLIRGSLSSVDAVILSDYNKGVLTPALLEGVIASARAAGLPVTVDPKIQHFRSYRNASVITPNHHEAAQLTGIACRGNDELSRAAAKIQQEAGGGHVLITRGDQGMTLLASDGAIHHIATVAQEVYDVTGAGDTVVATLALSIASGASVLEAAMCANHAAGVVVGKVGTATISIGELLSHVEAGRTADA